MLDSGTMLTVKAPLAEAKVEREACGDLVERIVSDRLWLTHVKTLTEVRPPCCQYHPQLLGRLFCNRVPWTWVRGSARINMRCAWSTLPWGSAGHANQC